MSVPSVGTPRLRSPHTTRPGRRRMRSVLRVGPSLDTTTRCDLTQSYAPSGERRATPGEMQSRRRKTGIHLINCESLASTRYLRPAPREVPISRGNFSGGSGYIRADAIGVAFHQFSGFNTLGYSSDAIRSVNRKSPNADPVVRRCCSSCWTLRSCWDLGPLPAGSSLHLRGCCQKLPRHGYPALLPQGVAHRRSQRSRRRRILRSRLRTLFLRPTRLSCRPQVFRPDTPCV